MKPSNRTIRMRRGDAGLTSYWIGSLGKMEFLFARDSGKVALEKMKKIRDLLDELNVHEIEIL